MVLEKKVSVIIPTYYRNEELKQALQSVEKQDYPSVEVIVVDDSGERHARPVASSVSSVTYIPLLENRGAQRARARGVDHASGQYIQFLDDDDRLLPGKLSKQVELLSANEETGVAYCGLQWDGGPTVYPRPGLRGDVLAEALRFDTSPCMMGTMLIERDVLDRLNLLKHDHAADDIGLKIQLARLTEFDYIDEVLVKRGNSADSLGTSMRAVDARFKIINMYDNLYREFQEAVRREALAETYLVQGQVLLRDTFWSLRATSSFALATYYAPGIPLPYLGSLLGSVFGRPGYDFLRNFYSRFVLGTERRGKQM